MDARGVDIVGPVSERGEEILSAEALAFVAELHHKFESRRRELLRQRRLRQRGLDQGLPLDFPAETQSVREGDWRISPAPDDLADRRVEITGPVDRKMMINALNSGASGFMADFEDSLAPSWHNIIEGQVNVRDAVDGSISYTAPDGRQYGVEGEGAVIHVRPRGWHLVDRHVQVDGSPVSGALLDFSLFVFHNAQRLLAKGSGPYVYVPKLEGYLEARLWRDVFVEAEGRIGLPPGSIKATVLIETLPAAFEMDEILYELRSHTAGLNAGRWDYIFSMIKSFRGRREFVLPDRVDVTMSVPFMRAYTELLVQTCHRRDAHAMGGMAALVPSRKNPEMSAKAIEAVASDKRREATDGFDGTWVAHPDVVSTAMSEFDRVLGDKPNQVGRLSDGSAVGADDLLDAASAFSAGGKITDGGLRNDIGVAIRYMTSWLDGRGAVAINGLMEDAATAEIARSQVWQWCHHAVELDGGQKVTRQLVEQRADEEVEGIRSELEHENRARIEPRVAEAHALFIELATSHEFAEFLTLPAYDRLA